MKKIIMSILLVFILNIIWVTFVQSDTLPSVMCSYLGAYGNGSYTFEVSDIPERCEVILYGLAYFRNPPEEDQTAITALKTSKKTVWMLYTFEDIKDWSHTIQTVDLNSYLAPMIQYLKNNKIDGVILGYMFLQGGFIPDYPSKINAMICTIKASLPSIKVGLHVNGNNWKKFGDKSLFDFTITNSVTDLYAIDMYSIGRVCDSNTLATGGRYVIKATNNNESSVEDVCKATANSNMDQNKITMIFVDFASHLSLEHMKSYSEYCSRSDSDLWCVDSIDQCYKQVEFSKSFTKGIIIMYLDYDDFNNTCGCGKYSIANAFIDAWQGKPETCCDTIA